jgi:hypothetical protein
MVSQVLALRQRVPVVRIALVRGDAPSEIAFGETFYRNLAFNGKSAVENGHDYEEVTYDSHHPDAAGPRIAERLLALAPTLVVFLAPPSASLPAMQAVEAKWPPGASRPTYVAASDTTEGYADFIGKSADRRHRVFATTSLTSTTEAALFIMRYNEAHPEHVTRSFNPGSSYDAVYLLAYAAFASGPDTALTGASLAGAFARLMPPGKPIQVGPTDVFEGVATLASRGNIDLDGVETALDLDPKTGIAPVDYVLTCPGVDAKGKASEDVELATYRSAKKTIEPAKRCP